MHQSGEGLYIDTSLIDIKSDCHEIPATEGIEGGVVCTGFIDVEKILRRITCHGDVTHYFLEKKLPFQILLIAFEKGDERSGSDSSGSDFSGSDCSGGESTD